MKNTVRKVAMAIASHPDDIEFMMAGTLLALQQRGYEIHYFNVANGALGTNVLSHDEIVAQRAAEARESAKLAGFVFHESICDDLEVFYNLELLGKVVDVVRSVRPSIVLTHGPYDYMEDHVNAGRLATSAAFCRGMTNFKCSVAATAAEEPLALYHSLPQSLRDQLNRTVIPGMFVNVTGGIEMKSRMLSCHRSQKEWLDESQGQDAYLEAMRECGRFHGRMSGRYAYAEGWVRHNPVGYCNNDFNPLLEELGTAAMLNPAWREVF